MKKNEGDIFLKLVKEYKLVFQLFQSNIKFEILKKVMGIFELTKFYPEKSKFEIILSFQLYGLINKITIIMGF